MPELPGEAAKLVEEIELLRLDQILRAAEIRQAEAEADEAERLERQAKAAAFNHRVYHFLGEVKAQSVEKAMLTFESWSRQDPGCSVEIVLNSPGGSVFDGLALYDHLDALRAAGHRVTVIVRGMAASMGGILLQVGDERVIGRSALVLIHEISAGSIGRISDIEDDQQYRERLQNRLLEILAARSTLSARQIKSKMKRRDWWLTAEESLARGFADRIA